MGISTRKDDQRAAALAWEKAAAAKRDAERLVAEWNKQLAEGTTLLFVPTVGAALLSGHHWLVVRCPGCDLLCDVDLRVKRRDPGMPITNILPSLKCRVCNGQAAIPRAIKLAEGPS